MELDKLNCVRGDNNDSEVIRYVRSTQVVLNQNVCMCVYQENVTIIWSMNMQRQ